MRAQFLSALLLLAMVAPVRAAAPDWIEKSNTYTQKVLELDARYQPEAASHWGMDQFDGESLDLKAGLYERNLADLEALRAGMKAAFASEQDGKVRQDLEILIMSLDDRIESAKLNHDLMLPYFNVGEFMFQGLQTVLDPRNKPERQSRAIERLKKYAGVAPGSEPLTELAMARTRERFDTPDLTGPYIEELKKASANTETFISGIADMFREAKLKGWQTAHQRLARQLREYDKWVATELMPRAREDNRLPEPVYADNLKQFGVTMQPRVLMRRAMQGFAEIRDEMQVIAKLVAREQGFPSDNIHDVLRELKKKQVLGDAIMPLYKSRLRELENIIRTHELVTLPARDSIIRLATEAESAASPAAFMNPPRLIGNQGEYGEFVLPLRNPNADPDEVMDDFINEDVAWTLTAHESRPGHELQFSAMVENGVSLARAIYAFNSANAEGWGLYAEAIVKEYLPLEGQLFTLNSRLIRAARAFLDPMLNLGLMQPGEAKAFLMNEVTLSDPMATQEVDRYTFKAPGQATSYYFGYMNMRALRLEVEIALGPKFRQKEFHDFVLAQGLLPPALLRKAVLAEYAGAPS
ncbi:MAG: DUF885 domain-containing protein [Gammaproteobacteria bacterium]|nr:DUF885 domain-containing protein [Gammaproteobacteria bacterium]